MSKCILNFKKQRAWCGRTGEERLFSGVDEAIARPDGEVCLRCVSVLSAALREPDPAIHVEFDKPLFHAARELADPLMIERPTSERALSVAATLMRVAAFAWLRFEQPENDRRYLPLDEERFSRLAAVMFQHLELELRKHLGN